MAYTTQTPGFSKSAEFVAIQASTNSHRMHQSSAIGIEGVLQELAEVWVECRKENWDGFDAFPVTYDSLRNAQTFLKSLPLGYLRPSVGAEPDGHVTLEWHHSRRRTLSVSISPDGELHYAALLGPGRICGTELFFGEVPQIILEMIHRVYSLC